MKLSRINFFSPYENSPGHENHLTRALLVVLRYSPVAHEVWLRLIGAGKSLYELPEPTFGTQRARVVESTNDQLEGQIPAISVWRAPKAAAIDNVVEDSDRGQVLDGIVLYDADLAVIVEAKVKPVRPTRQPSQINFHGAPLVFEGPPRCITWESVLEALLDLQERNLVSPAEHQLFGDFYDTVESYFPEVGPSSMLTRCADHSARLARRLDAVLAEALGADPTNPNWRTFYGSSIVSKAYLAIAPNSSDVVLRLYPGDTLTQARDLYAKPQMVGSLLGLRSAGWAIQPNFHWGFMAKGLAWSKSSLTLDGYCDYWLREIARTGVIGRDEWEPYWARLEGDGVVPAADKEQFDAAFTRTKRGTAHPRPGLFCAFAWPLAEARVLDESGGFVSDVRGRIEQLLSVLGGRLPNRIAG